jgi:PTS system mannose-specific IIA component
MKPIGILLVSTGNLSTSFQSVIGELLGRPPFLKAVALRRDDQWGDALAKVRKGAESVDAGRGVLVLADITGGTPFNVAQSLRAERAVEVIGGMNVPMVIKAVQVCMEMALPELATYIERYGRDHIDRGDPRRVGGAHGF